MFFKLKWKKVWNSFNNFSFSGKKTRLWFFFLELKFLWTGARHENISHWVLRYGKNFVWRTPVLQLLAEWHFAWHHIPHKVAWLTSSRCYPNDTAHWRIASCELSTIFGLNHFLETANLEFSGKVKCRERRILIMVKLFTPFKSKMLKSNFQLAVSLK